MATERAAGTTDVVLISIVGLFTSKLDGNALDASTRIRSPQQQGTRLRSDADVTRGQRSQRHYWGHRLEIGR